METTDLIIKLAQAAPGVAIAIAIIFRGRSLLDGLRQLIETINAGAAKRDEQLTRALESIQNITTTLARQLNEIMARATGGDLRIDLLTEKVEKMSLILEDLSARIVLLEKRPQ